jgi:hypothetical protein
MPTLVLWVLTLCGLYVNTMEMEIVCSSETLYLSASPHGVTTRQTDVDSLYDSHMVSYDRGITSRLTILYVIYESKYFEFAN